LSLKRTNYGRVHGYKLDGAKVEGVTTLLSKGLPKPGLPYWSAKSVAEYVTDVDQSTLDALRTLGRDGMVKALKGIPWEQRDSAAVRGTEVHHLAEKLSKGDEVDVPDHLAGHVESCVRFLDEWRPAPVVTEVSVASRRWRYAGTLDLVADLPDGRRALMDYKTSASGIWPETALQLSAYRHADFFLGEDGSEIPMSVLDINCAYAVHLRADGYDVIPVDTTCAKVEGCCCGTVPVFDTFLHIAYVARQVESGLPGWVHEAEQWAGVPA
jgi:hypothetical protein